MNNIFTNLPLDLDQEVFETLAGSDAVRIERIISKGHSTEAGTWYDQEQNEFVILLKGAASIVFESDRRVELNVGDWLRIKAHEKHRVEWTKPDEENIWLAVHY